MGVKGLTKILCVLGTNLTISIYLKSQNIRDMVFPLIGLYKNAGNFSVFYCLSF